MACWRSRLDVGLACLAIGALGAGSLAADEPLFADGFEPFTGCAPPGEPCPLYQSCSEASASFWGCFELPYAGPPSPMEAAGPGGSLFAQNIDAYFLIDRSGSMQTEMASLKANLTVVTSSLTCPPLGTGTQPNCIQDLWTGAGTIGYAAGSPYLNHYDLAPARSTYIGINATEDSGCCNEATSLAAWSAITGLGTAASGCSATLFAPRASCAGSPAANAGYGTLGFACFRDAALPVIFIYTDEAPSENLNCPTLAGVTAAAQSAGVRLVGMMGSGATSQTSPDLATLASGSGAVDSNNANAPLVFSAESNNAAAATSQALLTLHAGIPLRAVKAFLVDVAPLDAVDPRASFVESIRAVGGGVDCQTPYPAVDSDGDGQPDTYEQVPSGETVCWSVVARQNLDVPAAPWVQLFAANLEIRSGAVPLDSLPLLFIVPAD